MTLKLVTDQKEPEPEQELPELALDLVAQHFKRSEYLASLKSEEAQEFVLVMRLNGAYIVAGSIPDYDRMVSSLEEAKTSLILTKMQGDGYDD
jgi:hypothetical protein